MLQSLYDFFYQLFDILEFDDELWLSDFEVHLFPYINSDGSSSYGSVLNFTQYLSITCSIISLIFIVVLCCLFVYKIIKLVGNLVK